jgi:quercetin dioxygenase-like cupin family protein
LSQAIGATENPNMRSGTSGRNPHLTLFLAPSILTEGSFRTGSLQNTVLTPHGFPWTMLAWLEGGLNIVIRGVASWARTLFPEEDWVSTLEKLSWKAVEVEKLSETLTRQMISGENATISQLVLKRGSVVPRHSHINEQYSWILSGKLRFIFDDRELVLGAGEILLIPANMPHSAVAEEDTVDIDIFSPRRDDWIRKEDAYLRK